MKILEFNLLTDSDILDHSNGEVTVPDTLDGYRRIVTGGLFDQKIFGSYINYTCSCGTLSGKIFENTVCPNCGVTIEHSDVRYKRKGHIKIHDPYIPYINLQFIRILVPGFSLGKNYMSTMERLCKYIYVYKVQDTNNIIHNDGNSYKLVQSDTEIEDDTYEFLGYSIYGIIEFLKTVDLSKINISSLSKVDKKLVMKLIDTKIKPTELVMNYLPVLPAGYRDFSIINNTIQLKPINTHYLSILRRNKVLEELVLYLTPQNIEGINPLINPLYWEMYYNILQSIYSLQISGATFNKIPIDSIASSLKGKGGLIRGELLANRVDYSSRSVIVSGPELNLNNNEIMLPYTMIYDVLRPLIFKYMKKYYNKTKMSEMVKEYKSNSKLVQDIIYNYINNNFYCLINRQPTLHGFSLLGFKVLVNKDQSNKSIYLHPLVVSGFNADKLSMSA